MCFLMLKYNNKQIKHIKQAIPRLLGSWYFFKHIVQGFKKYGEKKRI